MEKSDSQSLLDELLRHKEERRRALRRLPIEEKVKIINEMIEMVKPIKRALPSGRDSKSS
jgi:hypothetical protein